MLISIIISHYYLFISYNYYLFLVFINNNNIVID